METDAISGWIAGYRAAAESNGPAAIEALFTPDADYYSEPYAIPWHGHEGIVAGWLAHRDGPGETTFDWEPVAVTGDVAVVRGRTVYHTTGEAFRNLWLVRLTADGRCREFTEYWMAEPAPPGQ